MAHDASLGARVESRSRFQAVLFLGGGISGAGHHVVFAVLSIFTCGLFLIPWLIVAATSKENRVTLTVDANGNVIRV